MAGIASITEACIDVKDRACVDVRPGQCSSELDPAQHVLFSEVEAGGGVENTHVPNPEAIAIVHQKRPFTAAHFERWLSLFHETLEVGWTGPRAERAGQLADDVARVHRQHLVGEPCGGG